MEYMAKLKQKSQMAESSKRMLEMRAQGLSIVEIGKIFGVTRQRVYYVIKKYGERAPKRLLER
jgi:DNA-directed RNA polymerase specialized sigma subunit